MRKTKKMKVVELKFGKTIEELLHEMYVEKYLTTREIAETLGVSTGAAYTWLLKCNLSIGAMRENFKNIRGAC